VVISRRLEGVDSGYSHHLQVVFSVNTPLTIGPRMRPICATICCQCEIFFGSIKEFNPLPIPSPMIAGRCVIGTLADTMARAPLRMPEQPMPATTRPAMSMFDEVASPHISDPSSNIVKKERNISCTRFC